MQGVEVIKEIESYYETKPVNVVLLAMRDAKTGQDGVENAKISLVLPREDNCLHHHVLSNTDVYYLNSDLVFNLSEKDDAINLMLVYVIVDYMHVEVVGAID